jgi:hypothetical protein
MPKCKLGTHREGGRCVKLPENLRTLNKLVKDCKKTEITHKGKKYYILHICPNNMPVPLFMSTDPREIGSEIRLRGY